MSQPDSAACSSADYSSDSQVCSRITHISELGGVHPSAEPTIAPQVPNNAISTTESHQQHPYVNVPPEAYQ